MQLMSLLVCVANKRLVQCVSPLDATYKKHRGVVLSWLTRNPFGVRQLAAAFPASKSDSHGGWLPPAPARRLDFQLSTFNFQLSTFNFQLSTLIYSDSLGPTP